MASKKDFAGMNTGRVYGAIETATSKKGQQQREMVVVFQCMRGLST